MARNTNSSPEASAKGDAPNKPAPPLAPTGRRVERAAGPGSLRAGVGKMVQRTAQPHYCGAITGRAFGYTEHPNSKDAKKISTRFAGQFLTIDYSGVVI